MTPEKLAELRNDIRKRFRSEMEHPLARSPRIDWLAECLRSINPNNYCIVHRHKEYEIVFSPQFVVDTLKTIDEVPEKELYYIWDRGAEFQMKEDSAVCKAILGLYERQENAEKKKIEERIKLEEEIRADYRRRW